MCAWDIPACGGFNRSAEVASAYLQGTLRSSFTPAVTYKKQPISIIKTSYLDAAEERNGEKEKRKKSEGDGVPKSGVV